MPFQSQAKTTLATVLFLVGWIVAVCLGSRTLLNYESRPGRIGTVPQNWPGSRIQRAHHRATLVMLAHPHCPCTRASVGELAQIMAQAEDRIAAYVLFLKPEGSSSDWEKTDLWRSAAAIPGVTVLPDVDGAEARRFGVETSGHTVLFDNEGRLLFSGGITGSRGHSGDNAGRSAIVSLLRNHRADRAQSSVFGCSLLDRREMADDR
jgi:hypothetical protein